MQELLLREEKLLHCQARYSLAYAIALFLSDQPQP
jgi:hypothetical protein